MAPELTEKEREVVRQIEADLRDWVTKNLAKTPEEHLADAREFVVRQCEKFNAQPLQDRLSILAAIYAADQGGIELLISDVKLRPNESGLGWVADVRLHRPIDQVFVKATVST